MKFLRFYQNSYQIIFFVIQGKQMHLQHIPNMLDKYEKHEFKEVLPILRVLAKQCTVCLRYPILNTLQTVAKMFMINQIQALFFVYFTRITDWDIEDDIIQSHSGEIKDLFNYTYESQEYKNMILYLTLISYSLKSCLNHQKNTFLAQALKICPAFLDAFQKWSIKYGQVIRKINPKDINKLYKSLILQQGKVEVDYIAIVDQILDISPPYSLTRDENKLNNRQELKRQAHNRIEESNIPVKKMKLQQNTQNSLHATFSDHVLTSLLEVGSTSDDYNGMEWSSRFNQLGIEIGDRPKRDLVIMEDDINNPDDDYYEEFNLGNNESLSEENIVFREFLDRFMPSDLGHGSTYDYPLKFIFESGENDGEQQ